MACAGDVPTLETLAAVDLLYKNFPDLKVRVVERSDRSAPRNMTSGFQPFSVLVEHGIDNMDKSLVARKKIHVAPSTNSLLTSLDKCVRSVSP